jgi:TolB-like protein/DNA-binding winged helix-turn-helix (wHTH) protein/Tfp pilus assembly protein PilF
MQSLNRRAFIFGPLRMDADKRALSRDGQPILLTPKEFDTLLALVEARGSLVEKEALIARVWPDTYVGEGSLARNISVLRKALGEDLIQTVPRRGYRLTVPVTLLPSDVPDSPTSLSLDSASVVASPATSSAFTIPARWLSSVPKQQWIAITLLFLLCSVGVLVLRKRETISTAHATTEGVPPRIAVLPFANYTGNDQQEYVCDGLTEAMISELSRLSPGRLAVIARTSAMKYKNVNRAIPEIAKELKADYILESSVRSAGGRLRITTQLVRGSDASHVWTGEYERDLGNILDVQEKVAIAIASEVRLSLDTTAEARLHQPRPVDAEVYQDYLLGRFYWNKRDREALLKSVEYFQRSIDRDPQYAAAYAGLADSYLILGGGYLPDIEAYGKARDAARRALELDNTLSEAYTALAYEKFVNERDSSSAEEDYQRALTLDPSNANAHHWYALYLAAMQRPDEAVGQIDRALELDPLSLSVHYNAGQVYLSAGRYDEALRFAQSALEIDPSSAPAHGTLAVAYQSKGLYGQAIEEFRLAQKLRGSYSPYGVEVAHIYALEGEKSRARSLLSSLLADDGWGTAAPYSFAVTYAALGDKEKAFGWLKRCVDDHSCTVTEINTDRSLDVLRTDPRFRDIRRQFHLIS